MFAIFGLGCQGKETADVEAVQSLACPTPGPLPFTTHSNAFENATTQDLLDDNALVAHENLDLVGALDNPQVITGRMARATNLLAPVAIAGEWVSLWTFREEWIALGRAHTDDDGRYSFPIATADRFDAGEHVTYAVLEGNGECAQHGVFLWPEDKQIVVTDIDGTLTLSDNELIKQLGNPSYDPVENTGASELGNAWNDKGYPFVGVTARPHSLRTLTQSWLATHTLPTAPLVSADAFAKDARVFKAEALQAMLDDGWQIVAAYGNAITDIQAYDDVGIDKTVTFIIGEKAGQKDTVAIPDNDYTDHINTYVSAYPDAP